MDKILLFLSDYIQIKGLTKSFVPLLFELISIKNKDNKIIVNASLKRDIGSRINATIGSIDNMITRLVDVGILSRVDRGMYTVNSELKDLSYKGKDNIQMKITYDDVSKRIEINGGKK